MRTIEQIKAMLKGSINDSGQDGLHATYRTQGITYTIQFSWGEGWEHASVSIPQIKRTPTWGEMCMVKDLFWLPEETVVQYHPAKQKYVNMHNYCLHLWRPIAEKLPAPPTFMI
ncbi:MAG: hypothetical protein PHY02_11070 [Phycisphaerae bacterium]|nr:hypothetical protein [Phycisphaerae bacterium]